MTKKIFIILIFVLALFSMQKIYAMTISDEIEAQAKEKLDNIISILEENI